MIDKIFMAVAAILGFIFLLGSLLFMESGYEEDKYLNMVTGSFIVGLIEAIICAIYYIWIG